MVPNTATEPERSTPDTTVEIHNISEVPEREKILVHFTVRDYDTYEWIGDFFVRYTERDGTYHNFGYSGFRHGSGLYIEHRPSGGILEHCTDLLEDEGYDAMQGFRSGIDKR